MAISASVDGPGTASPQSVHLVNAARTTHVFWQVGSVATISTVGSGTVVAAIIASFGAAFSTTGNSKLSTLEERVLNLHASVTLTNSHGNVPAP